MSAMEQAALQMAMNMLPKLLGPHMPKIAEELQSAFTKISAFQEQLDRIERLAQDNNERLILIMAGGHSIAERIEMGLGIQVETPERSIPQMLAEIGAQANDGSNGSDGYDAAEHERYYP